ncbi:hypothetical protein DFQ29_003427, partial [Apophysomyces sp. BC1021]
MSDPSPMDTPYSLICLVDGEPLDNAFSVEIEPTANVDQLKKRIKIKKSPEFDDIDANKLTLWHVSIPYIPANGDNIIQIDSLDSKEQLHPISQISDIFEHMLPNRTVHIIVQRPPSVPLGLPRLVEEPYCTPRIQKDVFHEDTSISRFLRSFVKGYLTIPDANCCVKGLPKTWSRSSTLREVTPQPALYLLHPNRPHPTTKTPPSEAALKTIC